MLAPSRLQQERCHSDGRKFNYAGNLFKGLLINADILQVVAFLRIWHGRCNVISAEAMILLIETGAQGRNGWPGSSAASRRAGTGNLATTEFSALIQSIVPN